jgi:hypothetical protein
MSKGSLRRRARRRAYLWRPAKKNPEKFWAEWSERLESWSREADRRARLWRDEEGRRLPKAFSLVDEAMNELRGCGREAMALEGEETREMMADSCCRVVAQAYDHRLYRLGARGKCISMTDSSERPERRIGMSILKDYQRPSGRVGQPGDIGQKIQKGGVAMKSTKTGLIGVNGATVDGDNCRGIGEALRRALRGTPKGEYRVDAEALRKARQGTPAGEYHVDAEALRKARQGTPAGEYHVDAEALRRARQGTPTGEYHVDAEALRKARQGTPAGEYHVDAEALRRARQGTPTGEYHVGAEALHKERPSTPTGWMGHWLERQHTSCSLHAVSDWAGGEMPANPLGRCLYCGGRHSLERCPIAGPVYLRNL